MIYVTTKRDRIKAAPNAWHQTYKAQYGQQRFLASGQDPWDITVELRKLNVETCSEEDVARIIGNSSWTELQCDLCETDRDLLVNLDGPYEQMTVCQPCLASAMEAATAGETGTGSTVGESAVGDSQDAQGGAA